MTLHVALLSLFAKATYAQHSDIADLYSGIQCTSHITSIKTSSAQHQTSFLSTAVAVIEEALMLFYVACIHVLSGLRKQFAIKPLDQNCRHPIKMSLKHDRKSYRLAYRRDILEEDRRPNSQYEVIKHAILDTLLEKDPLA